MCVPATGANCSLASVLGGESFGGTNGDKGRAMATDPWGNILFGGSFRGTDFALAGDPLPNQGSEDAFLAKLCPERSLLWSIPIGGSQNDKLVSIVCDDTGHAYLLVFSHSNVLQFGKHVIVMPGSANFVLIKLDPLGTIEWQKVWSDCRADFGSHLAIAPEGGVVLAGNFNSPVIDLGGGPLSNAGSFDIFVGKFTPEGDHAWSRTYGGSGWDTVTGVSACNDGSIALVGYYPNESIDFGSGSLPTFGGSDGFIAMLGSAGDLKWSQGFGGEHEDAVFAASAMPGGGIAVVGWYWSMDIDICDEHLENSDAPGTRDFFVASFSKYGSCHWVRSFGGSGSEAAFNIECTLEGNIQIAGAFQGGISFGDNSHSSSGEADCFVAELNKDGSHRSSITFGGSASDIAVAHAATLSANEIAVTGLFYSSAMELNGVVVLSQGDSDVFLARVQFQPSCLSDITCDGAVTISDLLSLLESWGNCRSNLPCEGDFNKSASVDVYDLLHLLGEWGQCL